MEWYRDDKAAVAEALRRGERPDLATTMASGPLDELVALHEEVGIFAILDQLEVQRARAGVPDALLLRTLATLPFVEQAGCSSESPPCYCNWAGRRCRSVRVAMGDIGTRRGGKKSRCPVIPIRCAMRCGASGSQHGCTRNRPGCTRSISGSWSVARSTPWMAAGWETAC